MADVRDTLWQLTEPFPENSGSASTQALNASANKVAWVFQAPTADPITDVFFSVSARTTPPTYTVGLQGLTSTGTPDGTYKGGGSPASATTSPSATGGQTVTLSNSYAPARGDRLALVIEYASGTVGASNTITVRTGLGSSFTVAMPYLLTNTGSWSKNTSTLPCFYGFKAGGRWYGRPATNVTSRSPANTSGNKAAVKFTMPRGVCERFTLFGLQCKSRPAVSSTAAYRFGLWNAGGTLLQSAALDCDELGQANAFSNTTYLFTDAVLTPLYPGVPYYIGFESLGNAQPNMDVLTFDSTALLSAVGLQGDVKVGSYASGAWTDQLELPLFASLILNRWDNRRKVRQRLGDFR